VCKQLIVFFTIKFYNPELNTFQITVADGGMPVWHFNGVITTYRKRDGRNSWRYASLAVNRGAIKQQTRQIDIAVCKQLIVFFTIKFYNPELNTFHSEYNLIHLFVCSFHVADGGMRVCHFSRVITTYGKRDCRNSW
jgi:hypothetical protein